MRQRDTDAKSGTSQDRFAPTTALATHHPPITLDEVSASWRAALTSAEDALAAVRDCGTSLRFDPTELHELSARLTRERARVGELLTQIAHDEQTSLHRPLTAPRATQRTLGLPEDARACVFDLDVVLAGAAAIHAAAWAETFDEFLLRRVERTGERFAPYTPFDPETDYPLHLHGKPRIAGVHAFLASRGIRLSQGRPDDPPDAETVYGLGNRKHLALQHLLEQEGVIAFIDSHVYLEAAHEAGLRCAVVSASTNTTAMLGDAGLDGLVDAYVDGTVIAAQNLRAEPAPDIVLAACRALATPPANAVLFATGLAGIDAGRAAGFLLVVAVDRSGPHEQLQTQRADMVVTDMGALLDSTVERRDARVHSESRHRVTHER